MISKVIITNRTEAKPLVEVLNNSGNDVCCITICNLTSTPLSFPRLSCKHVLRLKFNDVKLNPVTNRQVRKIKNFIINHHVNMKQSFVLVINCHAGISRSAAIGMFCKHNLGIEVQFGPETFPNTGVMEALGVNPKHWIISL